MAHNIARAAGCVVEEFFGVNERVLAFAKYDIDPERALTPHGHAIECRIYAEDPDMNFMPSPGLIRGLRPASGPGIRDDGGVSVGYTVPVFYDSMIAKLVAWGSSRADAVARPQIMTLGLMAYVVKITVIGAVMWLAAMAGWTGLVPMAWGIVAGVLGWVGVTAWRYARRAEPTRPDVHGP